jgi:hypothetical protein
MRMKEIAARIAPVALSSIMEDFIFSTFRNVRPYLYIFTVGKSAEFSEKLLCPVASHEMVLLDLPQGRFFDLAHIGGIGAARVEPAARRRVHRTRDVACEDYPVDLSVGVRYGDGGEERDGVRIERFLE